MRGRLVDRQTHLVETRYLHNATAAIVVHIIETKVRHDLPQRNDVRVGGRVLGKVILEDGHLLVRRRLASLAVQRRTIAVAGEQVVMDEGAQRGGGAARVGPDVEATLVVLHEIVLFSKKFKY